MKRWMSVVVPVLLLLALVPSTAANADSTLAWKPCSDAAMSGLECAFLTVPRDWAHPGADTVQLAMARHVSTGSTDQRIGSLFFNPGGPGGSGLEALATGWTFLPAEIKDRFDLVTWDPRGVGATEGLVNCPTAQLAPVPATGPVNWTAVQNRTRSNIRAANAACEKANADIVPFMGTNVAVEDLDAMRASVGDSGLTYWAWSYGTRIGYDYALRHPGRLRALMLDGSVTPNGSVLGFAGPYSVAADAGLSLLFQQFPVVATEYRTARALLARKPLRLSPTRTYTQWDLDRFLEQWVSLESFYPAVVTYVHNVLVALTGAASAKAGALAAFDAIPELGFDAMTGAPAVIQCLDYADRPTPNRERTTATAARLAAPITGWYRGIQTTMPCEGLALEPDPVPVYVGDNWDVPLLILGATLDAQTPYAWTVAMGSTFKASRTVTYVGAKHVTFGWAQSACVDRYGTDFLISRKLPAVNVSCPNVGPPK